ncbi:MAG: helix-turn-helix transcriptional regulator [Oscillospiraceae bacterium]
MSDEREKKAEPRRRVRPIDSKDVFVPEGAAQEDTSSVFRKRLTYLMNGNNEQNKPVNIQELADAVGVSRPAIRKYLKPKDHGDPTTPSSSTVCRIARYFGTTPDFLLGFDEPSADSARLAGESEFYNRLGLNQRTIDKLHALRALRADESHAERAATLLSMLDRQICGFVDDALTLLEQKLR